MSCLHALARLSLDEVKKDGASSLEWKQMNQQGGRRSMEKGKKTLSLNVVSSRNVHRGFGAGMIDLSNLSSIIIDGGEAYIDIGAIHAKSKVERGIRFT